MNTLLVIWRASSRSSANAFRRDTRARLVLLIGLLVQVISGIVAVIRLLPVLAAWRAAGSLSLQQHLWLTLLVAWVVIALFAILSLLQSGLSSNQALLLVTQPIEPATRLRALYGLILLNGVGSWLLFEAGVLGLALALALGWAALPWFLLLLSGAAFVAWFALVATLLVLRFVVPHLRLLLRVVAGLALLLVMFAFAIHLAGWRFSPIAPALPVPVPPLLVLPGFVLLLLLALFPLARLTGQLYLSALMHSQARAGVSRTLAFSALQPLLNLLTRSRTLTAALLVKGLLNQGRHVFFWARVGVVLVLLAIFPLVRTSLLAFHMTPILQIAGYASCLAALMLIEYTPYAISSEGNRLALYLVAPCGISRFLRARLYSFLCPALLVGLPSAILLGLWIALPLPSLLAALVLVALILLGYTAFTVLGSALDEDLNIAIEDRLQALMQEEMPITSWRLQLLGLTLLLLGCQFLLAWKLSFPLALFALAFIDGVVLLLMWRVSLKHLARNA